MFPMNMIFRLSIFLVSFVLNKANLELSNDLDKSVCEHWSLIAEQMTGEGKYQTCFNNKTDSCTRLDCSGSITYTHQMFIGDGVNDIEVDYCFGTQLNSCLKPVSMDFYLQVPSKNVTFSQRVRHDTEVEIKAISFPVGKLGTVYPVLYFEFEKQNDGNYKMSVTSKVKMHTKVGLSMFLNGLDRSLIDEETIHATSCSAMTNDTTDKPAAGLVLGECHAGKYSPPSKIVNPVNPSKGGTHYIPSATLGKSCDIMNKPCDPREICDLTVATAKCICKPESEKSTKGDACLSRSQYGQACKQHDDCGFWEICVPNLATCKCEDGYMYSSYLKSCVMHKPGTPTEPPAKSKTASTPSPVNPSVTPTSDRVNGTFEDNGKSKESSNWVPILGGVLGGLVLLALAVWGFIFIKRRKRNHLHQLLDSMQDDSMDSILGDTDDDVIM